MTIEKNINIHHIIITHHSLTLPFSGVEKTGTSDSCLGSDTENNTGATKIYSIFETKIFPFQPMLFHDVTICFP